MLSTSCLQTEVALLEIGSNRLHMLRSPWKKILWPKLSHCFFLPLFGNLPPTHSNVIQRPKPPPGNQLAETSTPVIRPAPIVCSANSNCCTWTPTPTASSGYSVCVTSPKLVFPPALRREQMFIGSCYKKHPRYELPLTMSCGNGPTFIAEITK